MNKKKQIAIKNSVKLCHKDYEALAKIIEKYQGEVRYRDLIKELKEVITVSPKGNKRTVIAKKQSRYHHIYKNVQKFKKKYGIIE